MKGVTHFFVSKDKLAVFWFLVCIGCIVGTAAYALAIVSHEKGRRTYVTVDPSPMNKNIIFIDNGSSENQLDAIRMSQVRLAVETLLNRGPNGPLARDRIGRLFIGDARRAIFDEVIASGYDFSTRKIRQLCEVGPISLVKMDDGTFRCGVSGQLVRMGLDPVENQVFNQVLSFTADLSWEDNKNTRDNTLYPYHCSKLVYTVKVTDSN